MPIHRNVHSSTVLIEPCATSDPARGPPLNLFKNKYRIESTRLRGYDYTSPGEYFVTICTKGSLKPNSLGSIINQIKSVCTKRIRAAGHHAFSWQPRFYDHIIRDDRSLNAIRSYIKNNPAKWEIDSPIHRGWPIGRETRQDHIARRPIIKRETGSHFTIS